MRISDWSSDVCSSDLPNPGTPGVFCICGPLLSGRVRLNPGNRGGNLDGNGATAPTVTAKGGAVALTDTAIRRAKPEDKPQKLRDGGGLYLLMRPDGARWWRMDYRRPVTGKRNTISLGTYPVVGLAEAREKHQAAKKLLAAGVRSEAHTSELQSLMRNTYA